MIVEERYNYVSDDLTGRHYEIIKLKIEYIDPDTRETKTMISKSVNGNPYTYLSSLDVIVYELEDGRTLATEFKRINKLSDSVAYKNKQDNTKRE